MNQEQRFVELWRDELRLSGDPLPALRCCYAPLAETLAARCGARTLVAGICGSQGSGKSTWARVLEFLLAESGLRTAVLSLDDLYLPWEQRRALQAAHPHNPYYAPSRGNPGTHEVELGVSVIRQLCSADAATRTRLPRFDKSLHSGAGDRLPTERWPIFSGRPDVVLFEGWFVGARPLDEAVLGQLKTRHCEVIAFEAERDRDGRCGRMINRRLADYAPLFDLIEFLIFLKVPALSRVFQWRRLQERKLIAASGSGMKPEQVDEFVKPYLLLTAVHGLDVLGDATTRTTQAIVQIGEDQLPISIATFEG